MNYVPKRGSSQPGLIVELKWDKPVAATLDQIREHDYAEFLCDMNIPVLLVGVIYDATTKKHSCSIEPWGS